MPTDEEQSVITESRKLLYQQLQENRRAAANLAGEYGRWLIASLLLVHGASILLLAQSSSTRIGDILPAVYWWHIGGLILAFACGFLAWINFGYVSALYNVVTPDMIYNDASWPKFDPGTSKMIGLTYHAAILVGFLSLGCLIGAAVAAYLKMTPTGGA